MSLVLTQENFDAEVMKSDKPILVDFWAPWCGPCQLMGPVLDELSQEQSAVKIGKLNVDEQPAIAQSHGIMSIPTMKIFKEGKVVKEFIGVKDKESLKAELAKL